MLDHINLENHPLVDRDFSLVEANQNRKGFLSEINREVFVLEKGVLWREGDEGKSARRVVPKLYRAQIVKLCHDPPIAGHQGIERTIEKVKSRYYWRYKPYQ